MNAKRTVVLGEGYDPQVFGYPYGVDYSPDTPETPIIFWEGSGHMASGGLFTAAQALEAQWADHVRFAGVEWVVPLIERLARGELVALEEVLAAYKAVHGRLPKVY